MRLLTLFTVLALLAGLGCGRETGAKPKDKTKPEQTVDDSKEKREKAIKELRAQLDEINKDIDALSESAKKQSKEERAELDKKIAQFHKERIAAEKKLDDLNTATAAALQELQVGARDALDALKQSIKKAREKIKKSE